MHSLLPFLLAMVAAIVLLRMLANKLRVAYPILLVLAGLAVGFVPGLPLVHVDPDLIFFIFLPPLLFSAAWEISFKEMRRWWRIIGSFAFLVVFFTALSVAVVTSHLIPGFTLALGFLLGGIVSPPDAVSTGAITRFVRIPKSMSAILQGESLLNDASSLIIFRFALIAVGTGQFIWQTAALDFLWIVAGGVGIGLGLAWLFVQAHKRLPTDATSDIALTLIEPYILYWVAEQLHCSGVLAVVSGGLFMANRQLLFLTSSSRVRGFSVWESFVFILNGLVFLLIGLQLPEIVEGLRAHDIPLSTAIGYGVLVTGVLVLARIISSYAAMAATLIFRPSVAPQGRSLRARWLMPLLLGWTGMRGVVSLAAALAIPVALSDGTEFPYRSLILFITFVVILLTLLLQGLTLPGLINRSGLFDIIAPDDNAETMERRIRNGLREHTVGFLKAHAQRGHPEDEGLRKLISHWEADTGSALKEPRTEHSRKLVFDMLESQRRHLVEVNRAPEIDEEIIRHELYLIDLEEERLRLKM
ncbi:MAG: Na+/H+ antiporter [Flavobacteriales bacterium]